MTEKSKAQRLANALDLVWTGGLAPDAAAELRRLDVLVGELVERLQQMCDETEQGFISTITRAECRLLIAKAKEQT